MSRSIFRIRIYYLGKDIHLGHFLHNYSIMHGLKRCLSPGKRAMALTDAGRNIVRIDIFFIKGLYYHKTGILLIILLYLLLSKMPYARNISIEIVALGGAHAGYVLTCLRKAYCIRRMSMHYTPYIRKSLVEFKVGFGVRGRVELSLHPISSKVNYNHILRA